MQFREWLVAEQDVSSGFWFDPRSGILTIRLDDGKVYRYETPWGGGGEPAFLVKWRRAVRAHPSNLYRVVLASVNKLIQDPNSNWRILERPVS